MSDCEWSEVPRCNVRGVHARWRPHQSSACLWMGEEQIDGEDEEKAGEEGIR